ncbi:MAG: hypothetical protein HOI95_20830 [Chromatiales bacterium]|jgi:adenylate cyclase|nr:hypothetical protein [Chromatiales bacterium]
MPDANEVAFRLGVSHVLEGSVRKMGGRLRISAQLIDAAHGRHLWAERYDGEMSEIFDFQDRIRAEIVAALKVQLTADALKRADERQTNSVDAYDLYLKGRDFYFRYSPDALTEAVKHLERATDIDPNFANALSYLSYCCLSSWLFDGQTTANPLDGALRSAETAVALAPNSAMAQTRLGWVRGLTTQFEFAF